MHGVEVEVWDLALCVRARLVYRDEADADTGDDLGGSVEARPGSGWQDLRRIVDAVWYYGEVFGLAACTVVHENARVADVSAREVDAEVKSIRADAEAGAEDATARDAACGLINRDGAIGPGVWEIGQVGENQRAQSGIAFCWCFGKREAIESRVVRHGHFGFHIGRELDREIPWARNDGVIDTRRSTIGLHEQALVQFIIRAPCLREQREIAKRRRLRCRLAKIPPINHNAM